jgi:hypothetical protein
LFEKQREKGVVEGVVCRELVVDDDKKEEERVGNVNIKKGLWRVPDRITIAINIILIWFKYLTPRFTATSNDVRSQRDCKKFPISIQSMPLIHAQIT